MPPVLDFSLLCLRNHGAVFHKVRKDLTAPLLASRRFETCELPACVYQRPTLKPKLSHRARSSGSDPPRPASLPSHEHKNGRCQTKRTHQIHRHKRQTPPPHPVSLRIVKERSRAVPRMVALLVESGFAIDSEVAAACTLGGFAAPGHILVKS